MYKRKHIPTRMSILPVDDTYTSSTIDTDKLKRTHTHIDLNE